MKQLLDLTFKSSGIVLYIYKGLEIVAEVDGAVGDGWLVRFNGQLSKDHKDRSFKVYEHAFGHAMREIFAHLSVASDLTLDKLTVYQDFDDCGPSFTIVNGNKGAIGQYLADDEFLLKVIAAGAEIKPGIDNRTK